MTPIKAAIIDLDGVVTQTASLHAKAWKKMFDAYNENRKQQGITPFRPFSIDKDYPQHLDGMPRYDGVEHFLDSRSIELPRGEPDDKPGKNTICGLGNWKNQFFHKLIEQEGVDICQENIEAIRRWRAQGIKTALISSSKNAEKIMHTAGVEHLFDARVDGLISEELGLEGKPAPDIFLEAAKAMQVEPSEAIVVEDALAGVEAGKKGGFRLVIGIGLNEEEMKERGADQVTLSLEGLDVEGAFPTRFDDLPKALEHFDGIASFFSKEAVMLCLDYDGTLTPIVAQYDQAVISHEMREVVRVIAKQRTVAVISGRDLRFIQKHMQLENVFYAGSHGYEIAGPDDFKYEMEEAAELLPLLDSMEKRMHRSVQDVEGADIERKRFAIAVHYRNVAEEDVPEIKQIVNDLLKDKAELRKKGGKKVIEVQPDIDWDKGKAVRLLYDRLSEDTTQIRPVYVGDDLTDEDAFREIRLMNGLGVLVGDHGAATYADFTLKNVDEVKIFLQRLLEV